MVANKKVTGTASSVPAGLMMGTLAAIAVTLTGALAVSYLVSSERLPESAIGYGSMIILLIAPMMSSAVAVRKIKHRRAYVCVLSGAVYYGLLIATTALIFGGQYQGMGVTGLVIAAGCTSVVLYGLKGEKRTVYRKRKISNR